jgi:hypothetical protein
VARYTLELIDVGLPIRYEVATALPDGRLVASTGQATLAWAKDSVTRTLRPGIDTVTQRIEASQPTFPGPSIPYLGVSFLMYELAFAAARRDADSSGASAIRLLSLVRSQTRTYPTRVWFVGQDSVEMDYFGVTRSGFRLDGEGRILRADWTSTTYQYRITRVPAPDADAVARAWHEREGRNGVMGVLSPQDSARADLQGAAVVVRYARPSRRGREIWGGLVPWGQVWRLGADRATHLETAAPIRLGGTALPAGRYTLWMLPAESGTWLIVSSLVNVWGTAYDPARDLARIPMTHATLADPVDRLTIALEPDRLAIRWDRTEWSVPLARSAEAPD